MKADPQPRLTTPMAIFLGLVLAGALAGTGAYFGLRARPEVRSAAPTPHERTSDAVGAATQTAQPTTSPSPDVQAKTLEAAIAAIDRHRPTLAKECADFAAGKRSHVVWQLSFDASGKQLSRGVREDRERSQRGAAACLSQHLPTVSIPAPGSNVSVEVPFDFP